MIKILIIIICFFGMTSVYGQGSDLDTVFVKKRVGKNKSETDTLYITSGVTSTQVLVGTTFIPLSDKMISLRNYGLIPISLDIIDNCDNTTEPEDFNNYPKLLDAKRDSNELIVDISVIANCCHNFLGEAEIIGKDTLNLVYTSYGGYCSCSCCYSLRFKFDTKMEEKQIIKYVSVNGSKTIGRIPKKE